MYKRKQSILIFSLVVIIGIVGTAIWIYTDADEMAKVNKAEETAVPEMKFSKENSAPITIKPDETEEKEIEELMETMTLEEKIGQMVIAGFPGTEFTESDEKFLADHPVGGYIFYDNQLQDPAQTRKLVNSIRSENNQYNRLPLFLSVDQEGGVVSRLPGNLTPIPSSAEIGQINNPVLSYQIGSLLGKELTEFGFNLNYAPVLDINSNPENPVIGVRSLGSEPELVSELGIRTMKGIASESIIPVIKHFPGHGDTSVDSHLQLPKVNKTLEELSELELIPFKRAIAEGADVVMTAHILLPELDRIYPASMSEEIITGLLRNELGFDGVVITDDLTMGAIINHFDIGEAAVTSVRAGSDIILVAHGYSNAAYVMDTIKEAVKNGEIPLKTIHDSVKRILSLKRDYELDHEQINEIEINELNEQIAEVLESIKK